MIDRQPFQAWKGVTLRLHILAWTPDAVVWLHLYNTHKRVHFEFLMKFN
jgi:hypothetical protein